jgi:hypothetical protein
MYSPARTARHDGAPGRYGSRTVTAKPPPRNRPARAPIDPDGARRTRIVLYAMAVSGIVGLLVVLLLLLVG